MTQNVTAPVGVTAVPAPRPRASGDWLGRLYRLAVVILAAFVLLGATLVIGRSAIYKIHEYERGLHLRGGRFVRVETPGWHVQIPLVDTVIIVTVNERLGYVERLAAMTSDNVTMDVSLQYTYRVAQPERFALEVSDPERIVFEFVQGKLRDVVNTKTMAEVMDNRAALNLDVMATLREIESRYGVEFITVQIQGASPPAEVVAAIKDRMVAGQRQAQAEAEAAQQRTLADAEFYAAQKRADGEAYQITQIAQAEAQRITLVSAAQQEATRAILATLASGGPLAEQYIQVLLAQELSENSKWIIGAEGQPILDLRDSTKSSGSTTVP
ncbi:MAG: Modulator of FtsH protease HflK [Chloroflexi bacterium ADurb.Bin360]|nr:MAG: Modulator of FtsH protease HflK [Chloroflexi bacterium ADurb.Bin360]